MFTSGTLTAISSKLFKKNGWVTDDEYRSWASEKNQRFLDDLSENINEIVQTLQEKVRKDVLL